MNIKIGVNAQLSNMINQGADNQEVEVSTAAASQKRDVIEATDGNPKIAICDRSLTFSSTQQPNAEVMKQIELQAISFMKDINVVLMRKKQAIEYAGYKSPEELIVNLSLGIQKLRQLKLFSKVSKITKSETDQIEPVYNAGICLSTLRLIFEMHFEYKDERADFENYKFEKESNIMVHDIKPFLNGIVTQLERIKENYLSIFRILIDSNINCESKYEKIKDYFGEIVIGVGLTDSSKSSMEISRTRSLAKFRGDKMKHIYDYFVTLPHVEIRNIACDYNKLQNMLDCLYKLKQVPNTYNNMATGYNVLKKSYDFYSKTSKAMSERELKMKMHMPDNRLKYYSDYREMCSSLRGIVREFYGFLKASKSQLQANESDKKDSLLSKEQRYTREQHNQSGVSLQPKDVSCPDKVADNNLCLINKEKEDLRGKDKSDIEKSNNIKISEKTEKEPIVQNTDILAQEKPIESRVSASLIETTQENPLTIFGENQEAQNAIVIPELATDISEILSENSSDEEDEIVKEVNSLIELMRQVCEKDRKEKIRIQEEKKEKAMQPRKAAIALAEEDPMVGKETIQMQKLGKTHSDVLNMLLSEKPPHLEILGSEVEGLIKTLGGRLEGAGNGSKFKVFWKGSSKKAGTYEVAHGGDRSGYLTSEWAKKAGEAIEVGMKYGLVKID